MNKLLYTARFVGWILKHPLNKGHSIKALGRYARWQLGSRLLGHPVVYPFVNDLRMYLRTGFWGATGIVYFGLEEYADMAFCAHLLRPGDLFVDVGTCFGTYSLLASGVAGARTIAFEPNPATAYWLEQNVELNQLGGLVEVRKSALGAETGTARFTSDLRSASHVVASGVAVVDAIDVPLTTLDCELDGIEPTVLKIDVEGYERNVLDGGAEVLIKDSLLAVIMEDVGLGKRYQTSSDIHQRMLGLGFSSYRYLPEQRQLVDLAGKPNYQDGNTLYLRKLAQIQERLACARPFRVLDRSI